MDIGQVINLRPFQQRGRAAIVRGSAALFFRMGYGKTRATLAAIHDLMRDSFEVQKVLVLAPKRVATVAWPEQIKNLPIINKMKWVVVHGKKSQLIRQDAEMYIMSYSSLPWLYKEAINHPEGLPRFDLVVFDESTYVKHRSSNRWKLCNALFEHVPRKVLLAGKPMPNTLLDIWAPIYLLDKGKRLFKNYTDFRTNRFIVSGGEGMNKRYLPLTGTREWIATQLADIAVTVMESEDIQMPPYIPNFIYCTMDDGDYKQYNELVKKTLLSVEERKFTTANAGMLSGKLRQYVQGFLYMEGEPTQRFHTAKLDVLVDILEQSQGENALIAIQFKEDAAIIKTKYPDIPVINSDTPDKLIEQYLEQWNAGKLSKMVVQPDSVAHGLNIQDGGHVLIYYSLTWNLDHYEQLIARLDRVGQTKRVVVHHIVMANTIDEVILAALKRKAYTQDSVLKLLVEYRRELLNGR